METVTPALQSGHYFTSYGFGYVRLNSKCFTAPCLLLVGEAKREYLQEMGKHISHKLRLSCQHMPHGHQVAMGAEVKVQRSHKGQQKSVLVFCYRLLVYMTSAHKYRYTHVAVPGRNSIVFKMRYYVRVS